jgi:mannose-6-phosphate isomerase-like protein (cupin superfamily)
MQPFAVPEGEGRTFWFGGTNLVRLLAESAQTHNGIAVMEITARRGDEPGLHVHDDADELFYVLAGTLTFVCGDQRFNAKPHSLVFLPRNLPHDYTITSDGFVRLLTITVPAGFDEHVATSGTPASRHAVQERLRTIAAQR